jgi:hypothetical protein
MTPEVLHNGIVLPEEWPPQTMRPDSPAPMPVPYLDAPPSVIPIDVGRQLFVDDFLIEHTDLVRTFHQPVDHPANPLLVPQTEVEMNGGACPVAAPFSDGCFYDPRDGLFKAWYMAGWFDGTALATSEDGIHWRRPEFDVVPGTNLVLPPTDLRRDGLSVWIDHDAADPNLRYRMYVFTRGPVKDDGSGWDNYTAHLFSSADGVHWEGDGRPIIGARGDAREITSGDDNNTFYYDPFRKKWVFSIRRENRPTPRRSDPTDVEWARARTYWEGDDFTDAVGGWKEAVFWLGADELDEMRPDYEIGEEPQIYKLDAVGYESLMIGLIQMHYGPDNFICLEGGFPKLTELQLAFSRDGFHWDRSNRETFIGAEPHDVDSWKRGYVHSVGGVCMIVGDQLHFYYSAFRGDEQNREMTASNGMYANGSMGLAVLRRDGFASMSSNGTLLTRPVTFTGSHLFVNVAAETGSVRVEVCDLEGRPLQGYAREDCLPVSVDSTKQPVTWASGEDLRHLAGRPLRFRFFLDDAELYAFWVSGGAHGASGGAVAAGGPGLRGYWDDEPPGRSV